MESTHMDATLTVPKAIGSIMIYIVIVALLAVLGVFL
jgi:hypothetical protein